MTKIISDFVFNFSKNFIDLIPGKKTEIIYTPESGNVLPDIKTLKFMSLYDSY